MYNTLFTAYKAAVDINIDTVYRNIQLRDLIQLASWEWRLNTSSGNKTTAVKCYEKLLRKSNTGITTASLGTALECGSCPQLSIRLGVRVGVRGLGLGQL